MGERWDLVYQRPLAVFNGWVPSLLKNCHKKIEDFIEVYKV
jgi:hypothetical protein